MKQLGDETWRLKKLVADQGPRWSNPCLYDLLLREGLVLDHERTVRPYREERLEIVRRRRRRSA